MNKRMAMCAAAAWFGLTSGALAQNPPRTAVPPPAAPGTNGGTPAPAQGPAAPGTLRLQPHLLIATLPDAPNCPAPDWIRPGTRITYFTSVAEVESAPGAVSLVPDPNGNITDSNGNRFREGTPVSKGVGGAGWDCIDIIAVEPNVVVLAMRQFQNQNGNYGPCKPLSTMAAACHPSGCDYFIHPALLAQLQESSANGVSLLKGTINHRGATYDAVRSTVEIPNSRMSSMYDLASGVQLTHNSLSVINKGVAYKQSGNTFDPQNNTTRSMANNQFCGVRELELPWRTMEMPAWVKTMKKAYYQGMMVDSGTPEMGLGQLTTTISLEVTPVYFGETFAFYNGKLAQQIQNMPPLDPVTIPMACGPGSIDAMWIHPQNLAQLQQGQQIDSDPNTNIGYVVEYTGPNQQGTPVVVITCGNETFRFSCMYDANDGKLLATQKTEKSASTGGMMTTQLQLVGME